MSSVAPLAQLVIIAKEPVAGRSKTRLTPWCTPEEAAALARASLIDTLEAVRSTSASRRVLLLDGSPDTLPVTGFDLIEQRGHDLGERLANGFTDVLATHDAPALVLAMDTPQVTPAELCAAADALTGIDVDAALGPAADGGYWCIGLKRADARVFEGFAMGVATTGSMQAARLRELGYRVATLAHLRDVDLPDDAMAIAALAPRSHFAAAIPARLRR